LPGCLFILPFIIIFGALICILLIFGHTNTAFYNANYKFQFNDLYVVW